MTEAPIAIENVTGAARLINSVTDSSVRNEYPRQGAAHFASESVPAR